jgi:hypothetical protein
VFKKREKKSEKKKVDMPSQKKLKKRNFSKQYHLHQICHTHAIYSIQVSYAFTPTLSST